MIVILNNIPIIKTITFISYKWLKFIIYITEIQFPLQIIQGNQTHKCQQTDCKNHQISDQRYTLK